MSSISSFKFFMIFLSLRVASIKFWTWFEYLKLIPNLFDIIKKFCGTQWGQQCLAYGKRGKILHFYALGQHLKFFWFLPKKWSVGKFWFFDACICCWEFFEVFNIFINWLFNLESSPCSFCVKIWVLLVKPWNFVILVAIDALVLLFEHQ